MSDPRTWHGDIVDRIIADHPAHTIPSTFTTRSTAMTDQPTIDEQATLGDLVRHLLAWRETGTKRAALEYAIDRVYYSTWDSQPQEIDRVEYRRVSAPTEKRVLVRPVLKAPDDVTCVSDQDGDLWLLDGNRWKLGNTRDTWSTATGLSYEKLIDLYGPLTDETDPRNEN